MQDSEKYKGYALTPDGMAGWSLLSPKGRWMASDSDKNRLKRLVDRMINQEEKK